MRSIALLLVMVGCGWVARAQRVELTRDNATVVLEGYAPGVVRVTMSLDEVGAEGAGRGDCCGAGGERVGACELGCG